MDSLAYDVQHDYVNFSNVLTLRISSEQIKSVNQSINARFVGRRYTTRPGAPAIVSCKHDQKSTFLSRFQNVLVSVMS